MKQDEFVTPVPYSPQNARLVALLSVVLGGAAFVIFAIFAAQEREWRLLAFAANFLMIMLFGLIDLLFIWRDRPVDGTWILIIGGLLSFFSTVFFIEDIGLLFGISAMLIVTAVVPVALPQRYLINGLILGMIIAAGIIILDVNMSLPRAELPDLVDNVVTAVLLIFIVAFGFGLVRNFSSFLLSAKLILTTLVIATLSILFVAFFVGRATQLALEQEVGETLNTLAESQSIAVGELLARQINILEVLAFNELVQERVQVQMESYPSGPSGVQNMLITRTAVWEGADMQTPMMEAIVDNLITDEVAKFQTVFPGHLSIIATDRYGAVLASSLPPPTEYIHDDEEWWISAYNNGFGAIYISDPTYNTERDVWVLDIAVPVRISTESGSSQIAAVIRSSYNLSTLADVLLASRFGETGRIELLLPNNRKVAVDDAGNLLVEENNLTDAEVEMLRGEEITSITALYGDDEHLVTTAPVNTLTHEPVVDLLEWQIVAHQNLDEGLATATEQQRINTILGVIVVMATGVGAGFVGRQLVQPITALTATAGRVIEGDLAVRAQVASADEIGMLATTFNSMTAQLQGAITNLENRVAERTRALRTSIEVGRELQTILQRGELAKAVVNRIQDAFDYYHVHMYLFDEQQEKLLMVGGTGEAGAILLSQNHQLPAGSGLVGRAAAENRVVLVPNVGLEPDWLPNPHLPDTRAEIAVPIALGDTVLGVLDVQHDIADGLAGEDADLLQLIASQVAVTLQNALLLEASQRQAEQEAAVNEIGQKIQSTTTMEAALQVAIRELGRVTRAQRARVLIRPETREEREQLPQAAD